MKKSRKRLNIKINRIMILFLLLGIIAIKISAQENPTELYKQGFDAINAGDNIKAESLFTKLIELEPNFERGYYGRGMAKLYQGDLPSAIEDFKLAIEKNPNFADAYNSKGLAHQAMNEYEAALIDFTYAVDIDPNFGEAFVNKAQIHYYQTELELAKESILKAEELIKDNPQLYVLKGQCFYELGDYSTSASAYTKAIALGFDGIEYYYARGNSYYKNENFNKAILDYSKMLEIDPDNSSALNNRAMAYSQLGDSLNADKDREKLAEIREKLIPDVDEMIFERVFSVDSVFSVELPKGWNMKSGENEMGDLRIIITEPESDPNEFSPYTTGIFVLFEQGVDQKYPVSNETEMLYHWEEKRKELNMNYEYYALNNKKNFMRKGKPAIMQEIVIGLAEDTPKIGMYEYALVSNTSMIHIYPQTMVQLWNYYYPVFAKIMDSVEIHP